MYRFWFSEMKNPPPGPFEALKIPPTTRRLKTFDRWFGDIPLLRDISAELNFPPSRNIIFNACKAKETDSGIFRSLPSIIK